MRKLKRLSSIQGRSKLVQESQTDVEPFLHKVQEILRQRLCGHAAPPIIHGHEEQRSQLMNLLKRSATTGESNSAIVIGPRGCGKTMLLSSCLTELRSLKEAKDNILEVHLNGFVQTDDRIALKEITRQLQLENTVGDKVFGSFAENLQFLLDSLKSGNQKSKSILFILDEFDAFTHHKNQTLLYNLFDIAQSAQTPICVLGLSCHLDVVELLEKRVRSRFSHRQIHLFMDMDFKTYLKVFKSTLSLSDKDVDKSFAKEWNAKVEELSLAPALQDLLKKQFMMSRDIRSLHSMLVLPVTRLSSSHPFLEVTDFISSKMTTPDSKAAMLHGVSVLELCLIIAMKHLNDIYYGEPFNFEMVYNVYKKFADTKSSWQMFEKPVILKAFEHLMALELVRPVDNTGARTQKEYRLVALLVDSSEITEALQKYPSCPTEIKQWAGSTVVTN